MVSPTIRSEVIGDFQKPYSAISGAGTELSVAQFEPQLQAMHVNAYDLNSCAFLAELPQRRTDPRA
jgi:hypothetical protein